MDVLVTGGAGFIGSHVCRTLRQHPAVGRVTAFDDLSTGLASNLEGAVGVALEVGTILDETRLQELVRQADVVVHLAAVPAVARSLADPRTSHDVNVTGTVCVLEAARAAGGVHTIVAGSSSVYGLGAQLPAHEDQPVRPASPYAAGKLAAEAYALAHGRCFDLPVLAMRFFNVYGPGQRADHSYAAVIPAFVSAALEGRAVHVHGDGRQTRDFTYVGDSAAVVADAVVRTVTSDRPVNVAFGGRRSLLAVLDELEAVLGRPVERVHGASRPGDVRDSQADASRLRELFPKATPTDLRQGLQATVDWFTDADRSTVSEKFAAL